MILSKVLSSLITYILCFPQWKNMYYFHDKCDLQQTFLSGDFPREERAHMSVLREPGYWSKSLCINFYPFPYFLLSLGDFSSLKYLFLSLFSLKKAQGKVKTLTCWLGHNAALIFMSHGWRSCFLKPSLIFLAWTSHTHSVIQNLKYNRTLSAFHIWLVPSVHSTVHFFPVLYPTTNKMMEKEDL